MAIDASFSWNEWEFNIRTYFCNFKFTSFIKYVILHHIFYNNYLYSEKLRFITIKILKKNHIHATRKNCISHTLDMKYLRIKTLII